jgi:hypothetical protein
LCLLVGCAKITTIHESGVYVVEKIRGGVLCQSRLEFYFIDREASSRKTYLGTCGVSGVVNDLHLSADHSCFAIAQGGASMVYLHRPEVCGAGKEAVQKKGGVYLHTAKDGDRLLYDDSHVTEMYGGAELASPGIRVGWIGAAPSKRGASAGQSLVISANGEEFPDGANH